MIVVVVIETVVRVKIEMEATIRGKKYEITKPEVIGALRDIEPQRVSRYSVMVDGRPFPIKQVISVTLGIPPMEFGTMTAYQILRGLGFEVTSKGG